MHKAILVALLLVVAVAGCQRKQLDEYGGYFDEKLGQYIYVNPGKSSLASNKLGVFPPVVGESQSFKARVVDVMDPDSLWIEIEDRQGYMLLAQATIPSYKDERTKRLKVMLHFVKPQFIAQSNKDFRKKWNGVVVDNMKRMLLNRMVQVNARYYREKIFKAVVMLEVEEKKNLNINLWMVAEGLSLYFKDINTNPEEILYSEAEANAKKESKGIWYYSGVK